MNTNFRILTFLFLSLTFTSCFKKDECKKVTCHNGGSCNDGECDCFNWYEGSDCSVLMRSKFLSQDATVTNDMCSASQTYLVDIEPGPGLNEIQMIGIMEGPLMAELTTGNHFFIPAQEFSTISGTITVSGSGDYQNIPNNDVNIVLSYSVQENWFPFDFYNCSANIHL